MSLTLAAGPTTGLPVAQHLCRRDVTGGTAGLPVTCHRTTLDKIADGTPVRIMGVCDEVHPEVARRLFDLGFAPGFEAVRLRHAPLGDPIVVRVADYEIALRRAQAACIRVVPLSAGACDCGATSGALAER